MSNQPLQRILAAVDLSSCSRAALEFALSLSEAYGTEVEVLFVTDDVFPASEAGLAEARKQLHAFVKSVLKPAAKAPAERVEVGEARERIVAAAATGGFDAIVLGTHGRTGRSRSLAGSVAEQTVRLSACPVITVREPA